MQTRGPVLFVVLLGLAAGCKEEIHAQVNCVTTAEPAVECTVKQAKGKREVEVCWDFSATCGNGSVVKAARTCHKIKDGGTEKVKIGADKLDGIDRCGGTTPPVAKMENLTIEGKPAGTE